MKSRTLMNALAGLALAACAGGAAAQVTKAEYNAMRDRATADEKSMRAQCDQLAGNRKAVCVAEANATGTKRRAEAEAAYKNTDKAIRDARIAAADADHKVAKTRCAAVTGNDRKLCEAEADAVRRKARADADARAKMTAAQREASKERIDADYDVALQRCNLLGGAAKDACVSEAKARFGR